ncbi:MAG: adenylate/guanylate cyclase domain-containing protein, partial [Planctomycetota bacterium]
KAAAAALAMLEALDAWKETSDLPAVKGFGIGIGLNTGVVTVGNLGSDEYFDYTVIGDNVNLGSRLEGLNKAYKTSIILSETTYRQIEDEFECRRLGKVTVVGKSKPVEIFELLGRKGETPAEKCDAKTRFEEGLALWEKGEFAEAAKIFRDAIEKFDDGPSKVFLDLSEAYEKEPPEDFQGVFIPKGK